MLHRYTLAEPCVTWILDSQIVVHGPVVAASFVSFLEINHVGPLPEWLNQNLHFNMISWSSLCILKFEKCQFRAWFTNFLYVNEGVICFGFVGQPLLPVLNSVIVV